MCVCRKFHITSVSMLKWDTQIFSSIPYPTQSLAKNQSISQSLYKFKLRGLKKKKKKLRCCQTCLGYVKSCTFTFFRFKDRKK